MARRFKPVPGPFGGIDEAATHEAFERFMGGPDRAFRLLHLYQESSPAPGMFVTSPGLSREDVFRRKAANRGFKPEEVEALLEIQ